MTSVTIQLTPETEQRLRRQASGRGETLETYLRHLAEKEAGTDTAGADLLREGMEWLTRRGADEVRAARERILAATPAARDLPAGKSIFDLVEGKWPGTETDNEVREALDRMS